MPRGLTGCTRSGRVKNQETTIFFRRLVTIENSTTYSLVPLFLGWLLVLHRSGLHMALTCWKWWKTSLEDTDASANSCTVSNWTLRTHPILVTKSIGHALRK